MGNTVVAKPSELTPLTANLLAEVIHEIGLPQGVVNIVHGLGHEAGQTMVSHPKVNLISFTGGTITGKKVAETAAPMFKKLSLELGGKNATIVLDDNTGDAKIIFATANNATITGTINGSATTEGTLQITGATKTFASVIGGTQDLTLIDIDNTSTFNEAISATNINVADSITATAKKAITATAIVLDGGTLVLSDNNSVTIAGTINGSNTTEGTLQITGATKTFSGAIGTTQDLTLIDVDNATIFNGSIEATTLSVAATSTDNSPMLEAAPTTDAVSCIASATHAPN